ncbi:hypothetical protein K490DRAFT_64678 [Saccharata proteae CBS 121410]|uniref:Uncharacterized protein n=1 Tax=Saccharata proteae CBS 121410 TaxID=1314787 RepID=A0A9P4M182_9PEZI|nr:hypothetical protein K490DRAFT_64678 [Saccharata proteae CBS 121410]
MYNNKQYSSKSAKDLLAGSPETRTSHFIKRAPYGSPRHYSNPTSENHDNTVYATLPILYPASARFPRGSSDALYSAKLSKDKPSTNTQAEAIHKTKDAGVFPARFRIAKDGTVGEEPVDHDEGIRKKRRDDMKPEEKKKVAQEAFYETILRRHSDAQGFEDAGDD